MASSIVNLAELETKMSYQLQNSHPYRGSNNVQVGYVQPPVDEFTNTNNKMFKLKLPGHGILNGSSMVFDCDIKVTGGTGLLNRNASSAISYIEFYIGSKRIQRINRYGVIKTLWDNLDMTQDQLNSVARLGEGIPAWSTTGTAQHYTLTLLKNHILYDKIPLDRLGQVEIWIQFDNNLANYTGGTATAISVTNPRLYFSRIVDQKTINKYNGKMSIHYIDWDHTDTSFASTAGSSVSKTFKYDVNYTSLKGFLWYSRLDTDIVDVTKADKYDSLMQRNAMVNYKFRFNSRDITETFVVGSSYPTLAFHNLMVLRGRFRDGTRESHTYPSFFTANATTGYPGNQFIIGHLFAAHRHTMSGLDTSKNNSGLEFVTQITTSAAQTATGWLMYDKIFTIGSGKNPVAYDQA